MDKTVSMPDKCSQCGVCCSLFLINLTEEEYKSARYKTQFGMFELTNDFDEAEMCGANIVEQKKDSSCIYLKDNRCSIHDTMPKVCREFFCTSKRKEFEGMIKKICEVKTRTKE